MVGAVCGTRGHSLGQIWSVQYVEPEEIPSKFCYKCVQDCDQMSPGRVCYYLISFMP